jgi:hypothetical protein
MPNIFEQAREELKCCCDPQHIFLAKQLERAKRAFLAKPSAATRKAVDYAAGRLKEALK